MSSCIKDLYDYDLVNKYNVCKNILLKCNFHKNTISKDGLQSQRKFCVYDFYKHYYNLNCDLELERCKEYNSQNRGKIK